MVLYKSLMNVLNLGQLRCFQMI